MRGRVPAALAHDVWMPPNGNVLFADGQAVTAVTPGHRVIFRFRSEERRGGGAYSCQRLDNGNTLIGENSKGRVLEVDRTGRVVFQLQTTPVTVGAHQNMRMARKLDTGANLVKEHAPGGEVVGEPKTPYLSFAAVRTTLGTTLVSTLDHLYEYDASGQVVWQFAIGNMTGLHLLPDGSVAVGCYRAYSGRVGTALFEISRDRRLVWRYAVPGGDTSMMAIQRLDERGKPLPGRCPR
jgi:hypothetical protein